MSFSLHVLSSYHTNRFFFRVCACAFKFTFHLYTGKFHLSTNDRIPNYNVFVRGAADKQPKATLSETSVRERNWADILLKAVGHASEGGSGRQSSKGAKTYDW